jgi:predicted nucleic acid-binding protein
MVFVDTSVWIAFFLPQDADHERVIDWYRSATEPVLTTDYCIDEVLTTLLKRRETRRALDAGKAFFHSNQAEIHFLLPGQIQRAWILFQRRATAGWSFTDCTSKIVIDDLDIRSAAALDEHFQQFGIQVMP